MEMSISAHINHYTTIIENGDGYAVGLEDHTPREAVLHEGYRLIEEDAQGRVLAEDTRGQLVVVADIHGPWGAVVGGYRIAVSRDALDCEVAGTADAYARWLAVRYPDAQIVVCDHGHGGFEEPAAPGGQDDWHHYCQGRRP